MHISILTIVGVLLLPASAAAWNANGHRYIADLAERLLTEPARSALGHLLASQGKKHLHDVADWADQIRVLGFPGQPSHAVRIPWDQSYSAIRDCPKQTCALGTLQISAKVLAIPKINDSARAMALNYVVHLIGDIHQPLHVSVNRAFSSIELNGKKRRLHEIWDRDIADAAIARSSCESELRTAAVYQPAALVEWAEESHLIAYGVFTDLARYPTKDNLVMLPSDYIKTSSALACKLLHAAALRLALVLNATLDPNVGVETKSRR
jgi:hypothetical protein